MAVWVTVSEAVIIFELAWYPRSNSSMRVNSVAMSTLDDSSELPITVPLPPVSAAPMEALPDALVSA